MKIENINIKLIQDNPYQTRGEIEKDSLKLLIKSIRERGLINPITLLKNENGYFIVNGHRRFNAYKSLRKFDKKYLKIPAIVKQRNLNNELMIDLVHENLIREDLNPVEKGMSIKLLFSQIKETNNDVASIKTLIGLLKNYNRRGYFPESRKESTKNYSLDHVFEADKILKSIGISENNAITYLSILMLPSHMRRKLIFNKRGIIKDGKILVKQAEQLVRIKDPKYQEHLFQKALDGQQVKSMQAAVDSHLKKVERGEWSGVAQSNLMHKFKDDLERLEIISKDVKKCSQKISSFRVDTLIKLETTLEAEEFDSNIRGLGKELELLLNRINEKIIEKGMDPLDRKIEDFEVRCKMSKTKSMFRVNIPMNIVKKLNFSKEEPEFLKLRIVGRRVINKEK